MFCAFRMSEFNDLYRFLSQSPAIGTPCVCLETENGHSAEYLSMASELSKAFPGILLMGGNLVNPSAYIEYITAGFKYIRVGSRESGKRHGFYYPLASLLLELSNLRGSYKEKAVIILDDSEVRSRTDIIKSIALGADVVMLGKELARIVEAEGYGLPEKW